MQRIVSQCRLALRVLAAIALAALATLAQAQDHGAFVDGAALDQLFEELRLAPDEATARQIDRRIWVLWMSPDETTLAARMNEALAARNAEDPLAALDVLNGIVEDYPDYAEGWNQRATMLYLLGNYTASIADCERVLELEPRHFGALSGRAVMYLSQGRRALALRDMAAALQIHPFLAERRLFPELQQDITRI